MAPGTVADTRIKMWEKSTCYDKSENNRKLIPFFAYRPFIKDVRTKPWKIDPHLLPNCPQNTRTAASTSLSVRNFRKIWKF